jgi:hypothetical protein
MNGGRFGLNDKDNHEAANCGVWRSDGKLIPEDGAGVGSQGLSRLDRMRR